MRKGGFVEGEQFVTTSGAGGSSKHFVAFAHVAFDLAQRAGFARCAVRVSRTAETCDVVSLHGDSVDPQGVPFTVGSSVPNLDVKRLLTAGVTYGALTFTAVEWRGTTDAVLPADPGPWRDGDFLIALARDVDGNVRGSVLMDAPIDGMRPDEARLVRLSEELHLAVNGLLSTIENEDLSRQLKVAGRMRELVREVDLDTTLAELISLVREQMRIAFRADDVVLYLDAAGDDPPVGDLGAASASLHHALERLVQLAWNSRDLVVVECEGVRGGVPMEPEAGVELATLMREYAVGTLALVPIGAGGHCMGILGVIRRTGTPRWTMGESEAAVEVGRDLGRAVLNARRHEREQHLRQELERLVEYRSEMVSTISHELKNPIGVIQGHLEMLADSPVVGRDAGLARSLESIARGAERLATLADDLLVLSRVGRQNEPMHLARVDLGRVVVEAVEFAQVTAELAGVEVSVASIDGEVVVDGDRETLALVATNLLSNAVKYSDPGDRVSVKVLRRGKQVVLVCTDTGLGISEEDQARLFKEFFRSTNPAATARPGTGLGLVILQRVVALHHGHVEVDSAPGEGTTFRILLPTAHGLADDGGPAPVAASAGAAAVRVADAGTATADR